MNRNMTQYDGYFQQVLFDYYNPVSILELNKNESRTRIYNMSLRGSYEIVPKVSVWMLSMPHREKQRS
jgi:hypothetical protein